MKMSKFFYDEKICASCKHFQKKRALNPRYIEVLSDGGYCNQKQGFYKMNTLNMSTCDLWKGL
ncbi:hypothetical protein [Clostridium algidicarnis]|uniref:hypothetical protein n=1 Tax=Clostridium algidicarnis TaxID=37659 RepID=UPI001629B75E|nr:hypothetical protein [Clostridium algidicarnis]MBB6698293.1 hypothetical protein [Clostridium algidicarnis]